MGWVLMTQTSDVYSIGPATACHTVDQRDTFFDLRKTTETVEDASLSSILPSRHFVADTPSRLHPMRYAVQAPPLSIYP
jgi:hypothetical protein